MEIKDRYKNNRKLWKACIHIYYVYTILHFMMD